MDVKEAAAALNGWEYGEREPRDLFAAMKEDGLVAVFGSSDDLMEMRGAIYDEFGGEAQVTSSGVLTNDCRNSDCPYFAQLAKYATRIVGHYDRPGEPSWIYETEIPHETFDVMEDGDVYCRGIVFQLSDVP